MNIMLLGGTLKSRSSNSTVNTTNAKLVDSVPQEILVDKRRNHIPAR
jgi:hypothetical protein